MKKFAMMTVIALGVMGVMPQGAEARPLDAQIAVAEDDFGGGFNVCPGGSGEVDPDALKAAIQQLRDSYLAGNLTEAEYQAALQALYDTLENPPFDLCEAINNILDHVMCQRRCGG